MSTHRRSAKILVGAAAVSLALAACSSDAADDGAADEPPTSGTTTAAEDVGLVTYAAEQEFTGYNNDTSDSTSAANTLVLNGVLGGFWTHGPDGSVMRTEEFGTFERTSEDPLVVSYTYDDAAVWSDGEPIDCDDFLFEWAATSGAFPDAGFNAARTTGRELMEPPVCEAGDKTIEVTYRTPFADWETAIEGGSFPAHVIAEQAGVDDIIAAITSGDAEAMAAMAEFWNNGWNVSPGDLAEDITPSSGPYMMTAWDPGQSVTLDPNPQWWGTPAKSRIVFRTLAATGQAQALENGEVDVMDPQPNTDIVRQLEALGDAVVVQTGEEYTYESFDPNFVEGSIMSSPEARRAFALCLPRQQMVDRLIAPQNPSAELAQSTQIFSFEEEYGEHVAAFADVVEPYSQAQPNIAEARALLEEEGLVGADMVIGWLKNPDQLNQRRVDQIALVTATCGPNGAGFNIVDGGTPDFFQVGLIDGNYDVSMFAWTGTPEATPARSKYHTEGGQNNGEYSNPEVDQLLDELQVTVDLDEQVDIQTDIARILWEDLATIPVFTFPSLAAWNSEVSGVESNPTLRGLTWNMEQWVRS